MPPGSIRALVALTIVAIVIHETLAGRGVSLLLSETLLIVLAHYFASRRIHETQTTPEDSSEPNPLWLPRRSVRILIIASFVITALYLVAAGRWGETAVINNLWIVLAYFTGTAFGIWRRSRPAKDPNIVTHLWQHLLGLYMVIVAVFLALSSFTGHLQSLPDGMEKLAMASLLFYFGSR